MSKCKYCDKDIHPSRAVNCATYCTGCGKKLELLKQFTKECDEIKRLVGYDDILRRRAKKEAET